MISDRPAEGTYDNQLYDATDQGIVWWWDTELGDWDNFDGLQTLKNKTSALSADGQTFDGEAVSTEDIVIGDTIHYADSDSKLDDALNTADPGDVIILGNTEFSDDRVIGKDLCIWGTAASDMEGSRFSGELTFEDRVLIRNMSVTLSASITIDSRFCSVFESHLSTSAEVAINEDYVRYIGNRGGDVTIDSGTSACIVDGCIQTTVTDNGDNTVGDIA